MTFDFAMPVTLPHRIRQPGPLYFLSHMKVHIFGIAIEGKKIQVNWFFDEGGSIGEDGGQSHSPNAVVSMLHATLVQNLSKEMDLHSDNCPGYYDTVQIFVLHLFSENKHLLHL